MFEFNFTADKSWFTQPAAMKNLSLLTTALQEGYSKQDDLVLFKHWQAHLVINGSQVVPNTTIAELLGTVNSSVQQENISPSRVGAVVGGEDGLLTLGKFLLPLYQTRYSHGGVDSQNRHRAYAVGSITKLLCGYLQKQGVPQEYVLNQRLSVLELSYDLSLAVNKVWNGSKTLSLSNYPTPQQLDGKVTIAFNGSRTPTSGEVKAVKLSSMGVQVTSKPSLLKGIKDGLVSFKEGWVLYTLHTSFVAGEGTHSHTIMAGGKATGGADYKRLFPESLRSSLTTLFATLWSFETTDGVKPFRHALTGSPKLLPKQGKKGWTTASTGFASTIEVEQLEGFIEALLLEVRPASEWAALTGMSFNMDESLELSLFELAFQILWAHPKMQEINNIGRNSGTSKTSDRVKLGNVLEDLLKALDDNESLSAILPEDDEEEEVDEVEASDDDSDDDDQWSDVDSFDFD